MQDTALYDIALPEISSDMASKAEAERLAKLEERTTLLMWIFGLFTVLAIGGITTAIWQISALNGRVSGIESDVRWLRSSVEEVRLTQTAANPANPRTSKKLKTFSFKRKTET